MRPSYLLALDALASELFGRRLYRHEARYAARLECDLAGLDMFAQLLLVVEYGMREAYKITLGQEHMYTADLDALVMLKPWTNDGRDRYARALAAGTWQRSR